MGTTFDRCGSLLGDAACPRTVVNELPAVPKQTILLFGDALNHIVIERINVVLPGQLFPARLKRLQLLGVLVRQIHRLREIFFQVVEFPDVLIEGGGPVQLPRHAIGVDRNGFPALLVDGTVAK